eukprot:gene59060-80875_t
MSKSAMLLIGIVGLGLWSGLATGLAHGPADAATPSPPRARVYFQTPRNGARVPQKFVVRIGLSGMGVAPAGTVLPDTGHHHILIDTDVGPADEPIPSDLNHVHLGNGQTEATLNLRPGKHTLQLLLGDNAHLQHVPPVVSQKITDVSSKPVALRMFALPRTLFIVGGRSLAPALYLLTGLAVSMGVAGVRAADRVAPTP